tara:strand:- start:131 stop:265 length:135 start_codon:yes stop_codon:yes gene_type:complete
MACPPSAGPAAVVDFGVGTWGKMVRKSRAADRITDKPQGAKDPD